MLAASRHVRRGVKLQHLTIPWEKLNITKGAFIAREVFMIYCPECENDLDIEEDEVDEGEIVSCSECGTDFEIVTVSPIELKPVEDAVIDEEELEEMGDGDDS
jgi:alpha-aminoadipate carrier protein LysW